MDILHALIGGIFVALEPINLGLAIIGVIVGLFVGAMPGLGSVNGVAILLPFTFVIQKNMFYFGPNDPYARTTPINCGDISPTRILSAKLDGWLEEEFGKTKRRRS